MAGLQGSGKTTNSAKLARWFKQQGRNPLLVGADLQRPPPSSSCAPSAARSTCRCSAEPDAIAAVGDPVEVARAASPRPAASAATCVIVDTAGRLAIDAELMEQVRQISEARRARTTRSSSSTR